MTSTSTPKIRLYVNHSLNAGAAIPLEAAQAHYLRHVMRLEDGDMVAAFNAASGAWAARVECSGKRHVQLVIETQLAQPRACPDVWLAFALIKNKSELVVEKATELGVRQIHAIATQHSVVKHANMEKLYARAVEAAEQCERFDVPDIIQHSDFGKFLAAWPQNRVLLYGDESGNGKPLPDVLSNLKEKSFGILIGPEGGFSAEEHRMLRNAPFAHGFGIGPRILRADTAAVASLACLQMHVGDWQQLPHFMTMDAT